MNRRPRLELRGSAASPDEAAAVIAAIEQFLRDTGGRASHSAEEDATVVSAWVRAARLEGVDREPGR